ncbi:MAG TPA: hypothetical protein VJ739_09220 [Gemmataceae bacterium]|nr:hypothetical protein [Gemmataceae bacterium]
MGAFYGSIHFRTEDRDAVRRALEEAAGEQPCRFLLGTALRGWVAAYPEMHGQDERVVKAIVERFPGEVLHVLVHDSDIFAYGFYRNGEAVDEYNSCPDYFEEAEPHVRESCRGQPDLLAHLLAPGKTVAELRQLLSPEEAGGGVFADDLLRRFAELLALPNASTSYEYLQSGETDDIEGWDQFQHVPDDAAEKAHKREAEASIERVKERMRAEGLLLLERAAGEGGWAQVLQPVWCPDREGSGFLVGWSRWGADLAARVPEPLERCAPPWGEPAATGLTFPGMPQHLTPSPSGRYLAVDGMMPGKWAVQLWNLDTKTVVADMAQTRHVDWVGFAPDEKFLVTSSAGEGAVTYVKSGRRVSSFHLEGIWQATVHPSGVILVADQLGRLSWVDPMSGQVQRTLHVGGRQAANPAYQAMLAQALQQFQQTDPQALEQEIRAKLEKQAQAMEDMLRRRGSLPGIPDVEELIRRVREQMDNAVAQMRQQVERSRQSGAGPAAAPSQGNERVTCLECSADGRLVFAATDKGVRVFAWDALTAATESTPTPLFAAEAETVAVEVGYGMTAPQGMVYTLAHDAAGNRLLFGGLAGKVRFLDLATGRGGTLLDPPGRPAIQRLGLSRDRSSLCCTCQPDLFVQGKQRRPPLLQVWNYAALERRLAGV